MQLPRRSVRSIQELPSIYTAFPPHYKPVRTHSASTSSESARSPDVEDGLEVVPLEHESALSAPIVSAYLDEKEVFIVAQQEVFEKPLPNIPASIWGRTWNRMSAKYRVLAVLGLLAVILLTIGIALLAASPKQPQKYNLAAIPQERVLTHVIVITPIVEERETMIQTQLLPHPSSVVPLLYPSCSLNNRAPNV